MRALVIARDLLSSPRFKAFNTVLRLVNVVAQMVWHIKVIARSVRSFAVSRVNSAGCLSEHALSRLSHSFPRGDNDFLAKYSTDSHFFLLSFLNSRINLLISCLEVVWDGYWKDLGTHSSSL